MSSIKKIGILTSGGDAPGMNAVIRSVVRTALINDIKVVGIKRGYEGLLSADIFDMTARDVSDILHRGGTKLLTARCEEMKSIEGQKRAIEICKILGIDALFIAGGDGSLQGAYALTKLGLRTVGIPCTIDLDLPSTEYTIGFDTAVTTGMEAIGKIRDTSTSHERCSVVEVMGRNTGYIALWCALTGGAEEVMIPEKMDVDDESIIRQIIENRAKGKKHNLIIVAEGRGGSQALAEKISKTTGIQARATILGHLQRGGSPTALDRMHGSIMGYKAVEFLLKDNVGNFVVTYNSGKYISTSIENALEKTHEFDEKLYDIIKILAI